MNVPLFLLLVGIPLLIGAAPEEGEEDVGEREQMDEPSRLEALEHELEKKVYAGGSSMAYRKTSERRGRIKSGKGVKGRESSFASECIGRPRAPNAKIQCNKYSGCRLDCHQGYKFPDGRTLQIVKCKDKEWQVESGAFEEIPACAPECIPPCQNSGICVQPNKCNCSEMFHGAQCQYKSNPCYNKAPLPAQAQMTCTTKTCTVQCRDGYEYPDGSSIANLICRDGTWVPARSNWVTIPDCKATCLPPCQNGGSCLDYNVCLCPQEFKGPRCQYATDACSPQKLNFNGNYNCSGNGETFSCVLSCPPEGHFKQPPASSYICEYSRGEFIPADNPQCVFPTPSVAIHRLEKEFSLDKIFSFGESGIFSNLSSSLLHKIPDGIKSSVLFLTPEPGSCYTWGGSHYKTFDGKVISFDSNCSYTLVRDAVDSSFSINVEPQNGYRAVNIFAFDKEYSLKRSRDGIPILVIGSRQMAIPTELPGVSVEFAAHYVVFSLSMAGVTVKWDGGNFIAVDITESLWNHTAGLCGRMDSDPENDLETKDGQINSFIAPFVNSWQVDTLGETCPTTPDETHQCNSPEALSGGHAEKAVSFCEKLRTDPRFAICRNLVDVQPYYEACRWDYCACKHSTQSDCACNSVAVFVRECGRQGVTSLSSWRDADTCPMTCRGGRVYMSCQPASEETCSSPRSSSPQERICEEGCYCPEGTVLHNQECIERRQCPCQLRGRVFQPGESIPKDCNTCTCTEGQWVCTQINCASRCGAVGDPHYITFDGYRYDFMGKCSYYMVKGQNYSIETENVPCLGAISESMFFASTSGAPSCTKAVTVRLGNQVIRLKQNREVLVNGAEIRSLPAVVAGAYIHIVSSIFLLVELPNGIVVWWDGATRVYVDAPPTLHGQTQGLCGTFNMNQKDDFLTPEGDVEQSVIAFANKWKTQEKCEDEPEKEPSSPCDVNVHNKATAQKYCSQLHGPLFASCHWLVDYQPYYKDCMFDLCSCQQKIGQCLCPIMAAYAKECARKGVHINWRNTVRECGIHCPGGQVYRICGNTCTRSCDSISRNPNCRTQCVEGCNCPEGQTLNDVGECIPISRCPCKHNGLEFRAGQKELQSSGTGPQLCTCVNADWKCQKATKADIDKYPSSDLKNKCSAAKNEEFTTCEPPEPLTCKNMHNPPEVSAAVCQAGCACKKGYVLEAHTKRCIKPSDCPCHHGGRSYAENDKIQEECNTCTCRTGKWECTERVCTGICTAWGDSHFKTYDGRIYDFHGSCDYVLSKGTVNNDSFTITIQNAPCGSMGVTCSKSITLKVTSGGIEESATFSREREIPSQITLDRIILREAGLFVFAEATDLGIVVQWDRGTRVYIMVDPRWKNKVRGLCGNYNDDMLDDFQTPSGGVAEVSATLFGDSWRLQGYCPESIEITDACEKHPNRKLWAMKKCGVLKSAVFQPCHSEVQLDPYMERCIFDTCACDMGGDCECLCTSVAAYAQECNLHGVAIKWRSQELCPIQCDERCSNYQPCVRTCPVETCDNFLNIKRLTQICVEETCVEGCEIKPCPPGQVYFNSTAMECVPVASCNPICLEIDGVTYYEGDLIKKDDCHSCYCSHNKMSCIGTPCTTPYTSTPVTTEVSSTPPKTSTTKPPNDRTLAPCQPGWSPWINRNPLPAGKSDSVQREPLPDITEMRNHPNSSSFCTVSEMKKIECRVVGSHEDAKETGLDAECSIESGLVCRGLDCPDFEIRVLCECGLSTTTPATTSAKPVPTYLPCDVAHPNSPHPGDCYLFYHCQDGAEGPELIEKTCGPYMMYNRDTQVCDHSYVVMAKWPHCGSLTTTTTTTKPPTTTEVGVTFTEKPTTTGRTEPPTTVPPPGETETTTVTYISQSSPQPCPPNEVWESCHMRCNQICHYYHYYLQKTGRCLEPGDCISGCVPEDLRGGCPPRTLWRDDKTCVQKADCTCHSHMGHVVPPGNPYTESDTEECQCLDNEYFCTNTTISTTERIVYTASSGTTRILNLITTETPPSKCELPLSFVPLVQGDSPLPNEAFSASSESPRPGHQAHTARIYPKGKSVTGGSWMPAQQTRDEYLQIDLGDKVPVYGIVVQGDPDVPAYVTSYRVLHSDGFSYRYVMNAENSPMQFRGPMDGKTPAPQLFHKPVEARYLRINPMTWENAIAMRVEVIGCGEMLTTTTMTTEPTTVAETSTIVITTPPIPTPECEDEMGLDKGVMSEEQVLVSSVRNGNKDRYGVSQVALSTEYDEEDGSAGAWIPASNDGGQWIQFDFLEPRNLTGIVTKGQDKGDAWTESYKVQYSHDGEVWNPIITSDGKTKKFPGNFDSETPQKNIFDRMIQARYLRIIPTTWHNNIAMRVEVIGCYFPYPEITSEGPVPTTTTTTTEISKNCNPCSGLPAELAEENCYCDEPLLWDGKECINSTYCPCFVKHIRYQVGAVFHTEKCDVCVCKLNGVPECKKKECPPCAEGLQSTLSASCGCLCKPCPENTVLCPTTSICINETLWCNGVEDCPDDEINCNTSPGIVTTEPTVSLTPVITTPTPTPTPCPPVECEPGFRPVLVKPVAVKTTKGSTYTKGGRKGNRKPQPRLVRYNTSSIECPVFTCERITGNTTVCGKPRCPPSYRLVSVSVKNERCPRYDCVPPEATCNVTGRTFNTFDGTEFKYDICNHVLAEDYDEKKWDISLVSKCRGGGPCTKHLDVIQDEHSFILNPDLSLEFDGMTYTPDETKRIGGRNKAFFLTKMGDSLFFKSNRYGFWIVWDKQSNVKIGVPRKLKGRVDGLCGFYNGKPEDDKLMSSGILAKTTKDFGDSWSNGESPDCEVQHCPIELQNKALEMCALVRSEPLSKCQAAVNVDQFQSHCVETICECLAAKTPAEDCRCQALLNYVTKCQEADTSIDLTGWRIQHDCPADCKPPLVHYDCYRHECEPTCEGLRDSEQQCLVKTGNCFAGCFCPDGQLRKGDKCVKPAECRDCVCDGFGDPQYMTFDRSNYTFNGNCTYVAVQDVKPEGDHEYQVLVNNKQCPDEPASTCTHGITVKYKGNTVHINNTGSKLDVYVNGRLVADSSLSEPWLRLDRVPGTKVTVLIVPIQLEVSYFFHNYQFTVRLSSHLLGSQTEGLCGNCNGNKTDDILLSNGTFPKNIDDFGLSWLVPENSTEQICRPPEKEKGCIPLPPDEDPCLQLLDAAVFQKCRNILDPSPYIAACQFDLCHSLERKTAACRDMEAYVRDCERAGICLDWRSDVMCPYKCPEELEYRACQPGCINTCDNLMDDSSSCDSTIIDGCFCPEDKVLRGSECVNRKECEPCDAENHYDGDVWQPDYCTNCTCIGKSKECQRTDCSTSTTICDIGMTTIEVPGSEKECCKKVICVPAATTTPGPGSTPCTEPKVPVCQPDQEQTSVTGADGCIEIVCKCKPCKPLPETGTPDLEAGPLPLPEDGMVEILNTSGCCPHYEWVCDREECPRPNECRPPLIPLEDPKPESKCCPTYHCGVPPNECVIELKNSSDIITKKIGHTWQETPCTSCICLVSAGGRPEVRCNDTVCPSSDMSENLTLDYEVETVTPPGECCPHIRKNACKVGERILKPGESWVSQQPSHCEMFMCMETGDRSVKKDVVLEKCVTACDLGFKYHLPEPGSGECCGQCKPVGCVINGNVYTEGHIQISEDNCTQYYCLSNNGTFQVDTVTTKCPDIPREILDDYQVVLKEVPGECCKKPQYVACKHEGVIYQSGETWESLTDPCKNITCAESPSGELSKTEVLQLCPDSCIQGWQYVPPLPGSPLCCGQCKQVACVQDGQLYDAGSTWKSLDGCTEYSCANTSSGQFQVTSMSEPCPVLGDCKPENIYEDGCCRRCRIPEDNLINCKPQPSILHQKVIKQHDATHGLCVNLEPVQNFSVCEGHCTSSTRYNSITNKHENDCKCCQPTKYTSINVTMTCVDNHVYNNHIPVPTICSCHACGEELTSGVIASKTVS